MPEQQQDVDDGQSNKETKETSVAVDEMDVETDSAISAISKKMTVAEPVVPTTPPIVEETDEALPVVPTTPAIVEETDEALPMVGQGDREGLLPYTSETLAVSLHPNRRKPLSWRAVLAYALLALLLTNTILLWQDLTATHLYANTLDANTGKLRLQQDLGGYHDAIRLTTPLAVNNNPASALLGVYTPGQDGTQQLLALHRTASSISLQHSISLANGSLAQDARGRLLVESANGLQVVTQNGQVVWHMQGQQPIHGVHPFAPASDSEAVYTIASVTHSQIAAYALADGNVRWTQTLPDTLAYAPPFVVDGATLYVASDHNVFALNSSDGSVRWEKPYAARTLLVENKGQQHLLLALSSQGIQALQSDTGEVAWSFRCDPTVSTLPTQFYQGTMGRVADTGSSTLYATGVVWHMPTVREDVWLYAIDASTGALRWSQPIASGPAGVDAGRLQQPLLATENGTVIVQRTMGQNENAVTAYDAHTGTQHWNTAIPDSNTSSPTVFQLSQQTFAVFTTTTHSQTILWTPSFYTTCVLLLLLVSILGLLLLVFLPREQGIQHVVGTDLSRPHWQPTAEKDVIMQESHGRPQGDYPTIHATYSRVVPLWASVGLLPRYLVHIHNRSLQILLIAMRNHLKYTYIVSALALLCICISISIFAYARSSQPEHSVLATDAQGSVVITGTSNNMHQLEALIPDGTRQWTLFSSEGVFSVPKAQPQAGTLLVALHGDTKHTYVVEDDPAYPRPLDTMLALYLLDRTTGHILWQQVVSYPDEQQNAEVVGVDTTYIYIAGEHMLTPSTQADAKSTAVFQLFAVNKLTGTVDWRIFGPTQPTSKHYRNSTLRIKNGQVLWHIANTTFMIDVNAGQIIGRE